MVDNMSQFQVSSYCSSVCRTPPATPGLIKSFSASCLVFNSEEVAQNPGVQKMGIFGMKYIPQIVFRRTLWAWETPVICPYVWLLRNYLCKCSDSALSNSPMVDIAVSNYQNVGQCSVKLSNGWTVLCPTLHWLVDVVSNCQMAGELSVQQSHGRTVLCPTVQWSDSAVSKCPKVR